MRLHRPLLALCAVFAFANIGIATFIAAAPQQPVRVTIAAASDDAFPALPPPTSTPSPQSEPASTPTPSDNRPTSAVTQPTPIAVICQPALQISPIQSATPIAPGNNSTISSFKISFPIQSNCPANLPAAKLRELKLKFSWEGLSPQALSQAALSNIILNADNVPIAQPRPGLTVGSPTREALFILNAPPLSFPYGTEHIFTVTADTSWALGGASTSTQLLTTVERLTAEIPYRSKVSTITITRPLPTTISAGLDANSPAGIQTPGIRKEMLRFWVTAANNDVTIQNLRLRFGSTRNGRLFTPPVSNVRLSLVNEPPSGNEPLARMSTSVFGVFPTLNLTVAAGQTKVILITADVDPTKITGNTTISAEIMNLGAVDANRRPVRTISGLPVRGNVLTYGGGAAAPTPAPTPTPASAPAPAPTPPPSTSVTFFSAGLDTASPAGVQTPSANKEVFRFWLTAANEATLWGVWLKFNFRPGPYTITTSNERAPIHNVQLLFSDRSSTSMTTSMAQVNTGNTVSFGNLNVPFTAGQTKRVRVYIDSSRLIPGDILQAALTGLMGTETATNANISQNPLAAPVHGNELMY